MMKGLNSVMEHIRALIRDGVVKIHDHRLKYGSHGSGHALCVVKDIISLKGTDLSQSLDQIFIATAQDAFKGLEQRNQVVHPPVKTGLPSFQHFLIISPLVQALLIFGFGRGKHIFGGFDHERVHGVFQAGNIGVGASGPRQVFGQGHSCSAGHFQNTQLQIIDIIGKFDDVIGPPSPEPVV